jgi:hypothetical protein
MRGTKKGWNRTDIDTVLAGFGFRIEGRSKHDKAWHPDHPELLTFLPRHRYVHTYLVNQVIRLIDRLQEMEETQNDSK